MWAFESKAPVKYNSAVISFLHTTCLLTPPPCILTLLSFCWFIFCPDPGPISNLETNITFWTTLLFDGLVWVLCETIYQQRLNFVKCFLSQSLPTEWQDPVSSRDVDGAVRTSGGAPALGPTAGRETSPRLQLQGPHLLLCSCLFWSLPYFSRPSGMSYRKPSFARSSLRFQ